ncbi:MAG: PEP-CTERM sorting domain-containing protein [Crocosphaera sp.]|nr:PEP-CTERM sorting domain-containing protein [Crocosphaera sp.]
MRIECYTPAQAALLGDEVRLQFGAIGAPPVFDETAVVIDPGIEFVIPLANPLPVDVTSDSFDITVNLTGFGALGAPTRFVLSDLDWVDTPGIVTDVSLTAGNAAEVSDISFTDDSITVDFINLINPPATRSFSFDIETAHVPEPGTILGLLTLAGLGFTSRLKRNIG